MSQEDKPSGKFANFLSLFGLARGSGRTPSVSYDRRDAAARPEEDPFARKGKVVWRGRWPSGYVSGLERIEREVPSFKEMTRVYFFCRDVGVAKIRPGAEESIITDVGQSLVDRNLLTQSQLDYIYQQFEFDPSTYTVPERLRHTRRYKSRRSSRWE